MTARFQGYHGNSYHLKILKIPINISFNISSLNFFLVFPMQILLYFLTWLGNLPQGKCIFILLFYPWLTNTIFLCFRVLLSLSLLLEFGTDHAIGDVAISVSTFPFPLTLPSEMLFGKELRTMALPTKSWLGDDYETHLFLSPFFMNIRDLKVQFNAKL